MLFSERKYVLPWQAKSVMKAASKVTISENVLDGQALVTVEEDDITGLEMPRNCNHICI